MDGEFEVCLSVGKGFCFDIVIFVEMVILDKEKQSDVVFFLDLFSVFLNVLVVDDNDINCFVFVFMLEKFNYFLDEVENGEVVV